MSEKQYGIRTSKTTWICHLDSNVSRILSFSTKDEAEEYAQNLGLRDYKIKKIKE